MPHPPHRHNGFVATYQLWMASGRVHELLVLELTELSVMLLPINSLSFLFHVE